jgi:hypothetical protein
MPQLITLEVADEVIDRVRAVAGRTGRRFEDVLAGWLERDGAASPDELSNEEVLALCDSQLPENEQKELSDLLWKQREEQISPAERPRLEELLGIYRRGLLRKAEALRVAVQRKLRPPLSEQ